MAGQRSVWRRLRNFFFCALGGLLAATTLAVLAMRWLPPFGSMFMVESYLAAWLGGNSSWHADYRWTPYARISRHAKLAVIASEDQKFEDHPGFDFAAIDAAIKERERGKRIRGASTISQQVAKNLFLWPGQSFVRKGLEAGVTLLIELCWPKQRILEVYLNIAEFADGVYGVGAAAPRFFRTDPAHLSQAQSALLATVLPAPTHLHLDRPSPYMWRRQAWIIEQMNELGGADYIRSVDSSAR